MIDGRERPFTVFRMSTDVGFIQLFDVGANELQLPAQHARDGHAQLRAISIVAIGQDFREHVGSRAGKLERLASEASGEFEVTLKIQVPLR